MAKLIALDVPPPGAGLKTVTDAVPVSAMSAAVIDAVICVALTYVVVRFDPFHRTTELGTNLDPSTVMVKPDPPAVALDGLRLVIPGTGLLIAKFSVLEIPPPGAGLYTVTDAVPAVAISDVSIPVVNCVSLT